MRAFIYNLDRFDKGFEIFWISIWEDLQYCLIQDRRHSDSSKYAARLRAEQEAVAAKGAAGHGARAVVVRSRKGDSGGGSGGDISERQRLSLGGQRCKT